MNQVRFSIITAVYNNKRYLEVAVESVMKQHYESLEYIIVDDGSTDGTGELADEIAKKYKNVRVIHQENKWIYASFNEGIKHASGEYIYILNSDDKLCDGSLKILDEYIEKYNHPDVIWTKVLICECDEEQNILQKKDINEKIKQVEYWNNKNGAVDAWDNLMQSDLIINQANLYKAKMAKIIEFRNDIYGADYIYNLDFARKMRDYLIIPEPIYLFYKYSNNSNASVGKYYGYEHEMYNEFYSKSILLLKECNKLTFSNIQFMKKMRMNYYSYEIGMILNSALREEEKFKKIFGEFIDSVTYEVAAGEDEEQLEARIFRKLRDYYLSKIPDETDEYLFAYKMLESLLRYEKDEEDYANINEGVNNIKNPHRIGRIFRDKILDNKFSKVNE